MPELPEVQTTVDGINRYTKGLKIKDIWTNYNSPHHIGKDNIKNPEFFSEFKRQIIGSKITKATRRAKNILIELSSGYTILIHMKMTGHLMYGVYEFDSRNKKDPWKGISPETLKDTFNRHIRFVINFTNNKSLALSDMRRFAKITHIHKSEIGSTLHLKNIGPEPLGKTFTKEILKSMLLKRPNAKIKTVLMDPKIIAGIGNIYSDEILWKVGIHPERLVKHINNKELALIFTAIQETLKKGIDFGGDSMSDYRNILGERGKFQAEHNAYRLTGKKCKKRGCKGIIMRKIFGGRSAHYCDTHQK